MVRQPPVDLGQRQRGRPQQGAQRHRQRVVPLPGGQPRLARVLLQLLLDVPQVLDEVQRRHPRGLRGEAQEISVRLRGHQGHRRLHDGALRGAVYRRPLLLGDLRL